MAYPDDVRSAGAIRGLSTGGDTPDPLSRTLWRCSHGSDGIVDFLMFVFCGRSWIDALERACGDEGENGDLPWDIRRSL